MTDDTSQVPPVPRVTITSSSSENAPFIYFDGVSCMGVNNGVIQIELAANILMPPTTGAGVKVEVVQTAHLRCSPIAAADLRASIDKALEMLQQGQQQAAAQAPQSESKHCKRFSAPTL
jgi:hypothetical protein